jgi:hypothetical protein
MMILYINYEVLQQMHIYLKQCNYEKSLMNCNKNINVIVIKIDDDYID